MLIIFFKFGISTINVLNVLSYPSCERERERDYISLILKKIRKLKV